MPKQKKVNEEKTRIFPACEKKGPNNPLTVTLRELLLI